MSNIAILSPHLDDAALSCSDHIFRWKKHANITVITLFTHYPEGINPPYLRDFKQHRLSLSEIAYEKLRKAEDEEAMKNLGCNWKHLDFTDAAFRILGDTNTLLYPTANDLFSTVSIHDAILRECLHKELLPLLAKFDVVVLPMGYGHHVDHVLTKEIGANIVPKEKQWFYFDLPYASLSPPPIFQKLWQQFWYKSSQLSITQKKRKVLAVYTSQMKVLFPDKSKIDRLSETVMYPKNQASLKSKL